MTPHKSKHNTEMAWLFIEAVDCRNPPDVCLECERHYGRCRRGVEVAAIHRHLWASRPGLFDKAT